MRALKWNSNKSRPVTAPESIERLLFHLPRRWRSAIAATWAGPWIPSRRWKLWKPFFFLPMCCIVLPWVGFDTGSCDGWRHQCLVPSHAGNAILVFFEPFESSKIFTRSSKSQFEFKSHGNTIVVARLPWPGLELAERLWRWSPSLNFIAPRRGFHLLPHVATCCHQARGLNADFRSVALRFDETKRCFELDVDALAEALGPQTAALIVNTPQGGPDSNWEGPARSSKVNQNVNTAPGLHMFRSFAPLDSEVIRGTTPLERRLRSGS